MHTNIPSTKTNLGFVTCVLVFTNKSVFVKKKAFVKLKILLVKCDSAFVDHYSRTRISFFTYAFLRHSCRRSAQIHKQIARDSQMARPPQPVGGSVVLCIDVAIVQPGITPKREIDTFIDMLVHLAKRVCVVFII